MGAAETSWRRIALIALVLGIALRAVAPFAMDVWEDGGEYVAMGHAWSRTHTFLLPSGEDHQTAYTTGAPGYSHHFPPAFPLYLGLVYSILGFGILQTKIALSLLAVATIGVVWACTRDLYGAFPATLVASLVALEPHLLWSTGTGYSENLSLLFFTLTLWAILRSLRDPRFIVLGGLFAGLAYLTRSSMGPFFLVAGLAGLGWRCYHKGWATFRDGWYLAGATLFAACVALWAWRNASLFGSVGTSTYLAAVDAFALAHPGLVLVGILGKAVFFGASFALYALLFLPELRAALRRWREESTSALLLAAGLVVLLAILVTATLWAYEPVWIFFVEHHRYVIPALVPLAWLALRDPNASTLRRWRLLAGAMAVASLLVLAAPVRDSEARAAEALAPHVMPGDTVAVVYMSTYEPYPILGALDVKLVPLATATEPEFILSDVEMTGNATYRLVGVFHETHFLKPDRGAWLLARLDVAEARGLAQPA